MFCDELQIKIIAGKGGDGAVSFRREKFVPRGGPDGGDGGYGGNIIIKVNNNLNTLSHLAHQKVYKAQNGTSGTRKNMHGKNAEHLIIEIPPGTIVMDKEKKEQLADLSKPGEQIIIAKGGKGGLGNARFASSTHRTPRFAEDGEPGEEKEVILELKLVADVGLIGLPSAGKSTLISVISNARPKIAAYHFTTLTPNLGVVNMSRFGGSSTSSFHVADIPGLIEGASRGKGLGHQFLKHISRTKLLVHIIDGSLENLTKNYKTIIQELKKFDKNLVKKEQIIVINKIDLLNEEDLKNCEKELKKILKTKKLFTISAITHEGLKPLVFEIEKLLQKINGDEVLKKQEEKTKPKEIPILKPHIKKGSFIIERVSKKKSQKTFHVTGSRIEQIIIMTNIGNPEGLERIYHYFNRMGIQKEIEKQGATFGDIIKIKDKSIPYRK